MATFVFDIKDYAPQWTIEAVPAESLYQHFTYKGIKVRGLELEPCGTVTVEADRDPRDVLSTFTKFPTPENPEVAAILQLQKAVAAIEQTSPRKQTPEQQAILALSRLVLDG